jgi:phage-related minor tail protein
VSVNAAGGVYNSAGLSRFSGGVYDTPRAFAFAKGVGIFGEAGPEAIMPLKRTPSGELGVQASGGGGGVSIQIIDQTTGGNAISATTEQGANGQSVRIVLRDAVKGMLASGELDSSMRSRYGVAAAARRVN